MLRHGLAVLLALRDGVEPPLGSWVAVAGFWDRIAGLVRSGNHDRKVVHSGYGASCQTWWKTLGPSVRHWRDADDDPRGFEGFEWLAGVMDEMDRREGGQTAPIDEAWFARSLMTRIALHEELIHVEEALRTVIVAPPDAMSAGQGTAAPAPQSTQT